MASLAMLRVTLEPQSYLTDGQSLRRVVESDTDGARPRFTELRASQSVFSLKNFMLGKPCEA